MADIAKVKRNIQRMIDQGAPESDIDEYVSSEGTTPEQLRGQPAQQQPAQQGFQPFAQAPMQPQGMDAAMNKAKGLTFNDLGNFADSTVRMLGSGATMGFGDKIAAGVDAGLGQGDYTQNLAANRAQTDASRETAGTAGAIAEVGGSVLPAAKLAQAGVTATRLPGVLAKYLGIGVDGAVLGGVTAAGNDQDVMQGAGVGAVGGLGGQALAKLLSGATKIPQIRANAKTPTPSIDDLRLAKNSAYQQVDDAGVAFAPEQMDTLVQGIGDDMQAAKLSPMRHPMATSMLDDIKGYGGKPATLTELDQLRQTINRDVSYRPDQAEGFFGKRMVDNIDEFTDANGGELMDNARAANTRYRNTDLVLNKVEKAERRAASSGSGGNADNAIRQNIRSILDSPKQSKFFDPKAREMMDALVRGGDEQNLLRSVGKLSPETGGLQAAISTIGSIAHPAIGIPAAAGFVSKRLADRQTKKSVDELLHYIATGASKPVPKGVSKANKELLARLIAGGTVGASLDR